MLRCRFYSNNSSFIHGGDAKPGEDEQKPVVGQGVSTLQITLIHAGGCLYKKLIAIMCSVKVYVKANSL